MGFAGVNYFEFVRGYGDLDSVLEWYCCMGGGLKQRLCLARMFYHKPLFAIFDECTYCLSRSSEGEIYRRAEEMDITVLTVTDRNNLFQYHDLRIDLDGAGGCLCQKIVQ